jgi:CcmD family protein
MKIFVRTILLFVFGLLANVASAKQVDMADGMRADGKIYVVVVIILVILLGLFTYLFLLDRKLNKMDKQLNERRQNKR